MARKKAEGRPTLEQVKAQEGRFTIALLGLPEKEAPAVGVLVVEEKQKPGSPPDAHRASFVMPLFEPVVIDNPDFWLDDYGFQMLYGKYTSLQVFKSDTIPSPPSRVFSDRLEKILTPTNKQTIYRLCTTPYWGRGKEEIDALIEMNRQSEGLGERITPAKVREFRQKVLLPFLTGWREMEKRFQSRRVIIDKIDGRLKDIERERTESLPNWLSQA